MQDEVLVRRQGWKHGKFAIEHIQYLILFLVTKGTKASPFSGLQISREFATGRIFSHRSTVILPPLGQVLRLPVLDS